MGGGYSPKHDPATALHSGPWFAERPFAVPRLEEAADLLQVPLWETLAAAEHVTPYLAQDKTQLWSLRQLARQIVRTRISLGMAPDAPPGPRKLGGRGGTQPFLTQSMAEAAVERARQIGVQAAAQDLGVSSSCLRATWHRLGISGPGPGYYAKERPHKRALTREQAEAAVQRAMEIGRDRTAEELGINRSSLTSSWNRYGIQGPGRGHAAVVRERRRRDRVRTMSANDPGPDRMSDHIEDNGPALDPL
jgi:hypothetical protein